MFAGVQYGCAGTAGSRIGVPPGPMIVTGLPSSPSALTFLSSPRCCSDRNGLSQLMTLLSKKESQEVLIGLLERLPEAMTDQTRIGTYGSWYNYYLCDFEGSITLPRLLGLDLTWLQDALNDLSFHSTAPRCQPGAGEGDG